MDDALQCDWLSIFLNTTTNCSNDIEVARDECKVICIISIMKGIEVCSEYLFDSGLLNQLKDLVKHCVYKRYTIEH
jgi:hypothetical protein